jgi:hypothetical protein
VEYELCEEPIPENHDYGCVLLWRRNGAIECRHGSLPPLMGLKTDADIIETLGHKLDGVFESRFFEKDLLLDGFEEKWTKWRTVDWVPKAVSLQLMESDCVVQPENIFVQIQYRRGPAWSDKMNRVE